MGERERFVWPPGRAAGIAGEVVRADASGVERAKSVSRWRSALLEFERTWLGLTAPPLRDRMEEEGWSPDLPHCYCRRCASTVGPHDADDTGCSVCRGKKMEWDRIVRLGAFSGVLREMVLEVKFTRWRKLGHDLGKLLGAALAEAMENEGVKRAVLVPVPMSARRRMARGIDHAMVISRGVSEVLGAPMCRGLERDHRPAQARLPASERRTNIAGAIRARSGTEFAGELVVVVDDVTTTRATMTAACRAVRKSLGDKDGGGESRVWGAVLGVTPARTGK